MKRMGFLSIACVAAFTVACNGNARTDNRTEPASVGTAGAADRTVVHDSEKDFINHQLSDGTAEVELSRMASERAANPDVKRFAQMLVQDHTKAGSELKEIAAQYSVQSDAKVDDQHQDLMAQLSKLRGVEFDREYIKTMVDDHESAVDSLESRVDSTASLKDQVTNRDKADSQVVPEKSDNAAKESVNTWAANVLPTVRHHLDEAKKLDDELDHSSRNKTSRSETKAPRPAADRTAPNHN
jgi:putative membrane protein